MPLHRHTPLRLLVLLCCIVCAHTACKKRKGKGSSKDTDKAQYNLPIGKKATHVPFTMLLREVNAGTPTNTFVQTIITTQNDQAALDRLFVTAQATPSQAGLLQAKLDGEKKYSLALDNTCISMLALYKSDQDSFRQGKPLKLNCRYAPDQGTAADTAIEITVTVVQKDAKDATVHQETRKITIQTKAAKPRKPRKPRNGKSRQRGNTI